MLKRRRSDQDDLLMRQEAPPAAPRQASEKPKGAPGPGLPPRPPAQRAAPAGTAIPARTSAPADIPVSGAVGEPVPQYHRKRRRGILLTLRPLIVIALLAGGVWLALPYLLRANRFRSTVEQALGASLGRKAHVGALQFTIGFGGLIASDVAIEEDPAFGSTPFLYARQIRFGCGRLALLFDGSFEVTSIDMSQPRIMLRRNAAGRWNFDSILTGGVPQPEAPRVRVLGGSVTVQGAAGRPTVLRDLSADFQRFSTAVESVFTVAATVEGGGALKLNGRAGPVIFNAGRPALPMSVLVNASKVALFGSGLTSAIAPAVDGALNFDGTLESDGNLVTVNGNASIAGLKLARQAAPAADPVLFVFSVQHELASGGGEIKRGEIHLGSGTAELTGQYFRTNGRTLCKAELATRGVPAPRAAALLGAAAIPLPAGATLEDGIGFAQLTIEGPVESPTTAGTVRIENARLARFDLQERLAAVPGLESLSIPRDLAIDSFSAKVNAGPERIALDEIELELPDVGALKGSGFLSDRRTLELHMEAVRRGSDRRPIPFVVLGPCSAPVFRPPGKL